MISTFYLCVFLSIILCTLLIQIYTDHIHKFNLIKHRQNKDRQIKDIQTKHRQIKNF